MRITIDAASKSVAPMETSRDCSSGDDLNDDRSIVDTRPGRARKTVNVDVVVARRLDAFHISKRKRLIERATRCSEGQRRAILSFFSHARRRATLAALHILVEFCR